MHGRGIVDGGEDGSQEARRARGQLARSLSKGARAEEAAEQRGVPRRWKGEYARGSERMYALGASRSTPETRGRSDMKVRPGCRRSRRDLNGCNEKKAVRWQQYATSDGRIDAWRKVWCGGADRATEEGGVQKAKTDGTMRPLSASREEKENRKKGVAGKRRRRRWMTRVMAQRQGTSGGSVGRQRGRCTAHERGHGARALDWDEVRLATPSQLTKPARGNREARSTGPSDGWSRAKLLFIIDGLGDISSRQAGSQPASQRLGKSGKCRLRVSTCFSAVGRGSAACQSQRKRKRKRNS